MGLRADDNIHSHSTEQSSPSEGLHGPQGIKALFVLHWQSKDGKAYGDSVKVVSEVFFPYPFL